MSSKRRVVVTGLGIVSPLGNDLETTWKNILNGESGAERITKVDASDFSTTLPLSLKVMMISVALLKRKLEELILLFSMLSPHPIKQLQMPI